MNDRTTPRVERQRFRLLPWALISAGLCVALGCVTVYNFATLSRDAVHLRDGFISNLTKSARRRVQFTVGPVFMGGLQCALSVVQRIPEEARTALSCVHQASVGVYRLEEKLNDAERSRAFAVADRVMEQRGWTRAVGVMEGESVVLIYVPLAEHANATEKVCLAVLSDEYLVIAEGRIRLEPLVELATRSPRLAREKLRTF